MKQVNGDPLVQKVAQLPDDSLDERRRRDILEQSLVAFANAHRARKARFSSLSFYWFHALEPAYLAAVSIAFGAWAAVEYLVARGILAP